MLSVPVKQYPKENNLIRLTDEQWQDILLIIGSYRSDLSHDDDMDNHVAYIDSLIEEILSNQSEYEIEFTLDEDE